MHRTAFTELVSKLRLVTPQQLAQLGTAVTNSQRRVEAVLALDARCGKEAGQGCPRCASSKRCRWGHTRTGAQRWRCDDCGATWSGLTGTLIAGIRRPDLFIDLVRNMMAAEKPWSCRKAAEKLDISRHTAWRWRMAIIRLLPAERTGVMSRIVEADEARLRESRKASREWVRYKSDPLNVPRPPREPWRFYKSRNATVKAPPDGWLAWNKNLVAVTDRGGHRALEAQSWRLYRRPTAPRCGSRTGSWRADEERSRRSWRFIMSISALRRSAPAPRSRSAPRRTRVCPAQRISPSANLRLPRARRSGSGTTGRMRSGTSACGSTPSTCHGCSFTAALPPPAAGCSVSNLQPMTASRAKNCYAMKRRSTARSSAISGWFWAMGQRQPGLMAPRDGPCHARIAVSQRALKAVPWPFASCHERPADRSSPQLRGTGPVKSPLGRDT